MIEQGLALTGIGMTFVFLFLVLLIMSMNVLAKVVAVLNVRFPEKVEVEAAPSAGEDGSEIALAIVAARACIQKG